MLHFPNKQFFSWLVLAAGLLISIGLSIHVRNTIQQEAITQFAFSADQLTIKVNERLQSYELILRSSAGLFESSNSVTRQEWKSFTQKLNASDIVPGMQGIGFALLIQPEELAAHIAAVRGEGFLDYNVKPSGQRDAYTPVLYIEPFTTINQRALGFDMFSEPIRHSAMAHARDAGLPTLSSRVTLVQDASTDTQPGILMYVPVYRAGMPIETMAQRRAALFGWAYGAYRITDFMSGIINGWETKEGRYVDLHIYDDGKETPDKLIFDSWQDEHPASPTPFYTQRKLDFYGHTWLLDFDRMSNAPDIDYTPALLILASGLAITGLLFGLLRSLADTISNGSRIASYLTKSLSEREAELLEAQRIGKIGSWKLDLPSGDMVWSTPLARLFGESPAGTAKSLLQQQALFTPESWERVTTTMAQALVDAQPYEQELEIIDTSGEHAWIRVQGEGICDAQGKVTGLHGTATDITEHKRNQLAIKTLTQLYAALSECNLAIVQCSNDNELFARLCKLVVEQGGMDLAWIGQVDANNRVVATQLRE
jgi:PAS domain S-box-containing protein